MPGPIALAWLPLILSPQAAATPEVGVRVERVLVDVRVLDRGRAVPDLGAGDFRVRIDGRPAEIASVTWLSARGRVPPAGASTGPADTGPGATGGRRVVFFVQKDLHPTRTPGLLQLLDESLRLVDQLGPADRAAVLSFDTHLKLWQDFTSDRARLRRALVHDVLFEGEPSSPLRSPSPSVGDHLDPGAARRATTVESALRLVGEALLPVAGSKTMVFLGWGFGELRGPRLALDADYGPALRALLEAGVAVFSLDVTDADAHSLEAGLRDVAEQTGGFYARTHVFTVGAMARLARALEGHYALEVVPPPGKRGRHSIEVDTVNKRGEVLARSAYFD